MAASSIYGALILLGTKFWYVWLLGMVLFGILAWYLFMFWTDMKRFAPQSTVEVSCSKPLKKKPMMRIVDGSGTETILKCLPAKNKAVVDHQYTFISPNILSNAFMGRTENGTPIANYVMPYLLPFEYRTAAALIQLVEHVRTNYDNIAWLTDDPELVSLIFTPDEELHDHCIQSVADHIQYGDLELQIEKDELIDDKIKSHIEDLYLTIQAIRAEMPDIKLKSAAISLNRAADICSVGVTNMKAQEVLMEERRIAALEAGGNDFFSRNLPYLTVLGITAGVVLIFMVVATKVM